MRSGIAHVAMRELGRLRSDRAALLLVTVVPLLCFTLLAATFSNAVIRGLRVAVVDEDHSPVSLSYVQAMEASPGLTVGERPSDLSGAMRAIRSGTAIAAVFIPRGMEHDLIAGRRPQIAAFANKQFLTPGNVASAAVGSAIGTVTAAQAGPPAAQRGYTPGTLAVEPYVLSNPALNYAQFLLRAVLPAVLHIVIAIAGCYAVGGERRGNMGDWLAAAGGSRAAALIGKLAPYAVIFVLAMTLGIWVIHGGFGIPFRGDPVIVAVGAVLMVLGYLAMGSLIALALGSLSSALALTAAICSPAFGFAGIGFPVSAMGAGAQAWGALLPLRWYLELLFDQAARGVPRADSLMPLAMLAVLAAAFCGLAWLLLGRVIRHPGIAPPIPAIPAGRQTHRTAVAFMGEWQRMLGDTGVLGMVLLAPVLYGFYYPLPYQGQLLRKVPVAVVDQDRTELSNRIVQMLDADEALAVAARPVTLADAEADLARRKVFAILAIPAGTAREVLKGRAAHLPAYVDSAYFLLYNRTLQGVQEAAGAVTAGLAGQGAREDGSFYRAALARGAPVELVSQPLFNPTGGYASYVVPAAFILILQQTLLLGAATLGAAAFAAEGGQARRTRGKLAAVIGQALTHLLIALPGCALYLIVLPRFYGFAAAGAPLALLAMTIPFLLATSFLGQFAGSWCERRETPVLLLSAVALPLFFMVGVAWPVEAIPGALRRLAAVFPSTFAIDGLVRLNQMGANFVDVREDWRALWILAVVYGGLAVLAGRRTHAAA